MSLESGCSSLRLRPGRGVDPRAGGPGLPLLGLGGLAGSGETGLRAGLVAPPGDNNGLVGPDRSSCCWFKGIGSCLKD